MEGRSEAGSFDRPGTLVLSPLEPTEPKPDLYGTDSNSDGSDAALCRAVQRAGASPGGDHQVPQPPPEGHRSLDSMALPNWSQAGRTPDVVGGVDREQCVGTLRSQRQATQFDAEPPGTTDPDAPGQGPQREGQGQTLLTRTIPADQLRPQLRTCLSQLVLENPGNNCFANASLLAVLWAMLSSDTWTTVQWGERSFELQQLLATAVHQPCTLIHLSWFQQLMNDWASSTEQGDPVEFTTHLLDGLRFQGFNFTWERRIQIGAVVECNDVGRTTTPLTFQIDPDLLEDEFIQLRHLVPAWVNQHGMQRALCQSTPLLCIHLERHIQHSSGRLQKSDIPVRFQGAVEIPFWTSDGLAIEWKDYQWISAIAHVGTDNSGHVQALMKVDPDTRDYDNPVRALLTDDGVRPQRLDQVPRWFQANLSCVWLCECRHLELHSLPLLPGTIPFSHRPYPRSMLPNQDENLLAMLGT